MNKPRLSRRSFVGQSALALSAVGLANASQAATQSGWIDAHVHVWTPDTKTYPLDENFDRSAMQPSSFTPEELFAHSQPAGVTRTVLIQMSFYRYDNSYMLDMMERHAGVFGGVAIVDHDAKDLPRRVKALLEHGVRGFRIHARGKDAQSWPDNAGMKKLWTMAAKHDFAVCPLINPADLPFIDQLCESNPDTRVVVDHFGRCGITGEIVPEELDALCRLARFPNVHVKTSAFYALGKKQSPYSDLMPMIRKVRDAFGAQRLMWASDCPYQVQGEHRYEPSLALIRDAAEDDLSSDDKKWMLRNTADKVFF